MGKKDEIAEISYDRLIRKTDMAMLLLIDKKEVWIPLSQVEDEDVEEKIVFIPQWLAEEKGLV